MALITAEFNQIASSITARFSELTGAPALVIDDRWRVAAGSEPAQIGRRLDATGSGPYADCLHLPIRLQGHEATLIVGESTGSERVTPRMAQALLDVLIEQALAQVSMPDPHDLKNKFIFDLLHGVGGDETDLRREGQILGMNFTRPRAVILIDAAAYILAPDGIEGEPSPALVRRRAQTLINSVVRFFHLPNDMICAYIGDGEVAVLKASTSQDLANWADPADEARSAGPAWADLAALKRAGTGLLARLRADTDVPISIGIGRYHPGIQGLTRSYRDAQTALALGRRFHGPNAVHCLDALGVAAFIGNADEAVKIELARQLLSPLDAEPDLLRTLQAFFAHDCSPSQTAQALVIHRNTLTLRFNKIRSLTGLDPRRFDDAVQMRLALLLRSPTPTSTECGVRSAEF